MTTIPTTSFGSWVNIDYSSISPSQYVADSLGDYPTDYDVAAITTAMLAAIQAELPTGLSILGNGELIGDAYGPDHDKFPEDVCRFVKEILDELDFTSLIEAHDLTERAAWCTTYPVDDNGQRIAGPIEREKIDGPEDAHQILRGLDDDLSVEDVGGEDGAQYDVVVTDEAGEELAAARVTAR